MSVEVDFNGETHTIPAAGEKGWAASVTAFIVEVGANAFSTVMTLAAEMDLGATYGIRAKWFRSQTTSPSTTGVVRLATADAVSWRNAGDDGNVGLAAGAGDYLYWDSDIVVSRTEALTLTNKTLTAPTVVGGSITATTTLSPLVVHFGALAAAAGGVAAFLRPAFGGATADTTEAFVVMPFAGKMSNFYVAVGTAGSTDSTVYTVMKNGSATTITCSLASGATTGNDTTHTATFAAGDKLSVKIVSGAAISPAAALPAASFQVTQA